MSPPQPSYHKLTVLVLTVILLAIINMMIVHENSKSVTNMMMVQAAVQIRGIHSPPPSILKNTRITNHRDLFREFSSTGKDSSASSSTSDLFNVKFVHLSYTLNADEMIVQWHTYGYDEGKIGKPMVIIGKSEKELINSSPSSPSTWYGVGAQTSTYGDSSVTGFDHAVLLNNLTFDTTYYYRAGFGHVVNGIPELSISSDIHSFTTRSADPDEVTIVMFGDMGVFFCYSNIDRITELAKKHVGDGNFFIYHVGDISYADNYPGIMYQYVWNKFFEHWEGIHPSVPYMVTVGNHEHAPRMGPERHEYEFNFTAYNHKFYMPLRNNSDYGHNMWYHFDFGPIRLVAFDSETNYENCPYEPVFKGDHVGYIRNSLQTVNRDETPLMITVGHRPIYCSEKEFSDSNGVIGDAKRLKDLFEKDFKQNKVDMMVCGHAHVYERQYPIYNGTIETKDHSNNYTDLSDTLYLISGAGGSLGGMDKDHDFNHGIPWNFMSYNKDEGFGVLKVKRDKINRRKVTVNWEFFNDKGDLIDQFTLTKTK